MKTQVISFYSDIDDKTYYSDHAKRLKSQLDSLGIPYTNYGILLSYFQSEKALNRVIKPWK
mgnify:CR=1 FL=1